MLLQTFMYRFSFKHLFSVFWVYIGVKLLGLRVTLTSRGTGRLVSKVAALFYILTSNVHSSYFFTSCQHVLSFFLMKEVPV